MEDDKIVAPAVHKDIVIRWEEILKKGLPKDETETLIKKYPSPENAQSIKPPIINPEIQVSVQDVILKRDERIVEKQQKIAACIAAVGKALTLTMNADFESKIPLFEQLSDTGRLLVDLQYDESSLRRSLIQPVVHASVRDTLKATLSDEMLFGKDLSEKVKSTKNLLQASKDLKFTSNSSRSNSKNFKGPTRRYSTSKNQQKSSTSGQKKYSTSTSKNRYKKAGPPQKNFESSKRLH